MKVATVSATASVAYGHSFYFDTAEASVAVVVTHTATLVTIFTQIMQCYTFNVLTVKTVIQFSQAVLPTADVSFSLSMNISNGPNYTTAAGTCIYTTNANPINCAVSEDLSTLPLIQYSINLLQGTFLIDQLSTN